MSGLSRTTWALGLVACAVALTASYTSASDGIVDIRPTETDFVVLEHTTAIGIANTLGLHFGPDLRVTPDLRTNKLVIEGPRERIEAAKKVIDHVDVPIYVCDTGTSILRIRHRCAGQLTELLSDLVSRSPRFWEPRVAKVVDPRKARRHFGPWSDLEKPTLVSDPISKSIVIIGTTYQRSMVSHLISELDLPSDQVGTPAAD